MGQKQSIRTGERGESFPDFPDQLVFQILSYSSLYDIIRTSLTCTHLLDLRRVLPELHITESIHLQAPILQNLTSSFTELRHLSVSYKSPKRNGDRRQLVLFWALAIDLIASNPRLKSCVIKDGVRILDTHLEMLLKATAQLQLERFEVSGVMFCDPQVLLPNFFDSMSNCATTLQVLNLSGYRKLEDDHLTEILNKFPNLHDLSLAGCTMLSQPTIQSGTITKLVMSECANLQSLDIQTPELKILNLCDCRRLQSNIADAIQQCLCITHLDVAGCNSFDSFQLNHPEVVTFDISGCSNLNQVDLVLPRAKHVDIGMCENLQVVTLELPSMIEFDLSLLSAEVLQLECINLVNLNLCGVRNLIKWNFNVPKLEHVQMSGTTLSPEEAGFDQKIVDHHFMPGALAV